MPRPHANRQSEGLTRTEVANQLGCHTSTVRRMQRAGTLPRRKDRGGIYRFHPREVARLARALGLPSTPHGKAAQAVYPHFLAPGFVPTNQAIARIVVATGEDPDTVRALWEKFKAGIDAPKRDEEAIEIARIGREFDAQIASLDRALVRQRRAAFLPGDGDEPNEPKTAEKSESDETPPPKRRGKR
jgi:excisionase family DNA binding protein